MICSHAFSTVSWAEMGPTTSRSQHGEPIVGSVRTEGSQRQGRERGQVYGGEGSVQRDEEGVRHSHQGPPSSCVLLLSLFLLLLAQADSRRGCRDARSRSWIVVVVTVLQSAFERGSQHEGAGVDGVKSNSGTRHLAGYSLEPPGESRQVAPDRNVGPIQRDWLERGANLDGARVLAASV